LSLSTDLKETGTVSSLRWLPLGPTSFNVVLLLNGFSLSLEEEEEQDDK
jgi:hypothetical protein